MLVLTRRIGEEIVIDKQIRLVVAAVQGNTAKGGMALNNRCYVDFGEEPDGSARAHEIRFPAGDSTSDIWN